MCVYCIMHHNKTRYNQCKPQNQTVWLTLAIHFKDVVSFKTDFLTRFDGIWRRVSPACCLSSSIIRVSPTSRSITRLPPSCCAIVYCRTSWGSAPPAWWTCRYTWAWLRWETRKRLLLINVYLFVFTGEVKKNKSLHKGHFFEQFMASCGLAHWSKNQSVLSATILASAISQQWRFTATVVPQSRLQKRQAAAWLTTFPWLSCYLITLNFSDDLYNSCSSCPIKTAHSTVDFWFVHFIQTVIFGGKLQLLQIAV